MPWNEETAARLGVTLVRLRADRDLTQEKLAYAAGVTKNQVQLLEAGRGSGRKESSDGQARPSNPGIATLAGLADALGLTVAELMAEAKL